MRVARIGLLIAFALAVSGCGAKKQAAASGGAEIVSASAPVFVSIDSDLSSDQWQQVDKLLSKFPARPQLVSMIRSSLQQTGIDYESDVKPALGDEIDVVLLDFANGGSNAVAVTKPKDADAFRRLIEKANKTGPDQAVFEERDGWFVISDTQEKLDRFQEQAASGEKLADNSVFKDALAELPDDALVHVYARGKSIVEALQGGVPGMSPLQLGTGQKPEFLSAAFSAEESGFRLVGAARAEDTPKTKIESFESKLVADVPSDAVAFLTFRGGDEFEQQMEDLKRDGSFGESLGELERMLGFRIDSLIDLFSHEVGLYVRPGSPIPEVTLLVDAPDEQEVLGRVNTTLDALTKTLPTQPCHAPPKEAGAAVKCIDLGAIQLRTAGFDDKVVLTTGQDAISKLRGDGPRLGDDDGFKSARDAAGLPKKSAGFIWIDLEDAIPMILGLADASGTSIPAEIRANLEPLGSFLAWAESDGRTGSFTAFLQID
ncbi:MAG: DUF3352 domain-containing protein [Actinomycetota bacterium]